MSEQIQRTTDEIGEPDEVNQVLLFDEVETLGIELGSMKIEKKNVNNTSRWDFVAWDNNVTSIWDLDDAPFTLGEVTGILGTNKLGTSWLGFQTVRVVNPANRHIERFLDDDFNDSGLTTATWGDSGLIFSSSEEVAQSTSIHLNKENIISATIVVTGTNANDLIFEMSNNGGDTWELVSIGLEHTFNSTGQDLKYRLTNTSSGAEFPTPFGTWGNGGVVSSATITKLQINYEV